MAHLVDPDPTVWKFFNVPNGNIYAIERIENLETVLGKKDQTWVDVPPPQD